MASVTEASPKGSVIQIDEQQIRSHVEEVVRGSVEETLKRFAQQPIRVDVVGLVQRNQKLPAPPPRCSSVEHPTCKTPDNLTYF